MLGWEVAVRRGGRGGVGVQYLWEYKLFFKLVRVLLAARRACRRKNNRGDIPGSGILDCVPTVATQGRKQECWPS